MTPAGHARRRLQRLALALVSLALVAGCAELAVRAFAPAWLRARMREVAAARSLTDWGSDADWPVESHGGEPVRFVPGSAFDVRDDEYAHRVRIDEYGGRASGRAPAGTPPIVPVFGDSMTFGLGVRDEETWVSLAGRSLPVRLENFGMPGSEMIEDLHAIDALDARLGAPRVCVFVVFLGNDLTQIAPTPAPGAGGSSPLSSWLSAANEALDQRSILRRWYVVQWTRALAVRAVNASRHEPQVQGMLALMDRAAVLEPLRRGFAQAADRLVSTAARLRFTPAVVIIPDHFQVDAQLRSDKAAQYGVPSSSYDPRQPNRIVTDALAARGVAFLDASSCLEGRAGQYFPRDGHLTVAGHETVARCVSAFIAERSAAAER